MHITLESDYAVRIVSRLARQGGRMDAKRIAEETGVTLRFSLKILRKLVTGTNWPARPRTSPSATSSKRWRAPTPSPGAWGSRTSGAAAAPTAAAASSAGSTPISPNWFANASAK